MSNLPSDVLAQTSNFLSLLFMLAIPVGTVVFSSLSVWNTTVTWAVFLAVAIVILALSIAGARKRIQASGETDK
ncbi:hypothetical protein ACOVJL_00040 [Scardovia wiggsiae]|uniref:hypothetical protein n=1 Tax=Scardovia wiggsiae TaxID=230143 RepID=UPI001CB30629|nr:hypothetical protein [Scardovia wiggsiae]